MNLWSLHLIYSSFNPFLTNMGLLALKIPTLSPLSVRSNSVYSPLNGNSSEYSMVLTRATHALFTCTVALHGTRRPTFTLPGRLLIQGIPHLDSTATISPILDQVGSKPSALIPLVGGAQNLGRSKPID